MRPTTYLFAECAAPAQICGIAALLATTKHTFQSTENNGYTQDVDVRTLLLPSPRQKPSRLRCKRTYHETPEHRDLLPTATMFSTGDQTPGSRTAAGFKRPQAVSIMDANSPTNSPERTKPNQACSAPMNSTSVNSLPSGTRQPPTGDIADNFPWTGDIGRSMSPRPTPDARFSVKPATNGRPRSAAMQSCGHRRCARRMLPRQPQPDQRLQLHTGHPWAAADTDQIMTTRKSYEQHRRIKSPRTAAIRPRVTICRAPPPPCVNVTRTRNMTGSLSSPSPGAIRKCMRRVLNNAHKHSACR